jgi:hypothetical protein
MKKILFFFICVISFHVSYSQGHKVTKFTFQKAATVDLSKITTDYSPKMMVIEMPEQGGEEEMVKYNYPENYHQYKQKMQAVVLPTLNLGQSFVANSWGLSTPNDNDFAISNTGWICSVINTKIYTKNVVTNSAPQAKSLAAWTTPINNKHQEFDPKVMYDPNTDRFVMVCLVGFVDTTSKVIIGFSQTNNPGGAWNLYQFPGNPLNNNLWTDYPMLSITDKEIFLSVNLLVNDLPWQTGFVETIIWQMDKSAGYAGSLMPAALHSNITFNGKPIRNLCPVKGGSQLYSPNMYFISNRNLASVNDSVFLVNVTDTIGAPGGTLTVKCMTTNVPYNFPPDGRQTFTSQTLATNDCRNLGAFYENGKIQYVHNTKNTLNNQPTVYHGVINSPAAVSPTVTGYIIQNDTMDFAYPNISYAGNSGTDNTSIITFDHSSDKVFAGCSAIRGDGAGNYSPVLRIQNGVTYVDLLGQNQERWGDYSGSQRVYSNPGEVWMSGYYAYTYNGSYPYAHAAWVAQIGLNPIFVTDTKKEEQKVAETKLYPNPAKDIFMVELNLPEPEYLTFSIYDAQGKLIDVILRDWIKVVQNVFSFNTQNLGKGIYFLKITGKNTAITKKVVVE